MRYALVLSVLLASCGQKIVLYNNVDARYDLFDSYVLIGLKGKNINTDADASQILKRIESAISEEMARRAYTFSSDKPDLIVRYEIVSGSVSQNRNNNFSNNPMIQNQFGGPMLNNQNIVESVLLLEIITADRQKLVWQASLDLKNHAKVTKRKDILRSAIETLFNTYLYRANSKSQDPSLKSTK